MMKNENKNESKLFFFIFLSFFLLFVASIILQEYIVSIAIILVCGFVFQKLFSLEGFLFFYLLKSNLGISQMKKLSKKEVFSKISEAFLFTAFGFFLFLFKKPRKEHFFGFLILLLIWFLLPFYSLSFLSIFSSSLPNLSSTSTLQFSSFSSVLEILFLLIFFSFGLFGFAFFSIFLNSFFILQTYFQKEKPIPGIVPAIPGYNLPLLSGILSLFILLTFHEFSHGVMSISKKVNVKSTGLLIAGVLPIGAFVENDEKKMEKISKDAQNQILIAGVAANILLSIFFFLFFLLILNIKIENFVQVVEALNSSLKKGDIIIKFGNFSISSFLDLKNAEEYYLSKNITNVEIVIKNKSGEFTKSIQTKNGKIGAYFEEVPKNELLSFFISFIELSFLLNFVLATTNLLPIPGLDGYKLLSNLVGKYSKIFEYITIFLFLLNLLPFFV
ncbi:MAG: site-2 protease family protein [Candidatus Micrarchaeia archaeon]